MPQTQTIQTERLILRPFTAKDAADVYAYWRSDPNWPLFNASVPADFSSKDASEFVTKLIARNRTTQPSWAMVYQTSVVGVVSLTYEQNHRIAVIGYGIHGQLKGRGMSTEAARKVIGQAFATYSCLRKIRAHTNAENIASARVLEKLGFLHEGTLRANQFVDNQFQDEAIYGLLREEFVADKRP